VISTHFTRAHLRILAAIPPERIRTHEQKFVQEVVRPGRPKGDLPQRRRETIRQLRGSINPATGKRWTQRAIGNLLGISVIAVRKHMRVLRGQNYNPAYPRKA
jgi:hypothetical protein